MLPDWTLVLGLTMKESLFPVFSSGVEDEEFGEYGTKADLWPSVFSSVPF